MIKHVVMWKLRDEAGSTTKAENAAKMKAMLEILPGKIKELKTAEVGINIHAGATEADCDVVLTTTCDSAEDLKTYAAHPEHQKVVRFITQIAAERRVVDYLV